MGWDRYYLLVSGPVRLSLPGPNDIPRYFDVFPGFNGTGLAITLWYRHCDPGDKAGCELYLLYASNEGLDSDSYCWAVWVQDNGLYFNNVNANPRYFYVLDFMAEEQMLNHRVWRHLAFVWNVTDNNLFIYIDGKLGARVPWGSNVSTMDCFEQDPDQDGNVNASGQPLKVVALGHGLAGNSDAAGCRPFSGPHFFFHLIHIFPLKCVLGILNCACFSDVEIFDLRVYLGDETLSASSIKSLANALTDPLKNEYKCAELSSDDVSDTSWKNGFGQNCQWFFENKAQYPGSIHKSC